MHPFPPFMHYLSRRFSPGMSTSKTPGSCGPNLQVAKTAKVFRLIAASALSGAPARSALAGATMQRFASAVFHGFSTAEAMRFPAVFHHYSRHLHA
jgi:hypothetical protein